MAGRRRLVSAEQARAAGEAVATFLGRAPEFGRVGRVALYAALPDELPTDALLALARTRGKRVLFPRMIPGGRLEFAAAASFEDLRPGRWGVLEPDADVAAEPLGADTLVCVPGVAFDREGHRLGRGRGYYDRTFAPGAAASPELFGMAYEFQVLDAVPHGPGDRAVDAVVTERALYRASTPGPAS